MTSLAHPPLHVTRVGAGPAFVLVHGSAADHTTWTIQLASPLKRRFTLIACDRRGTAASPLLPGIGWQRVEDHAADLAAVITAAAVGPAIVVGSSFGAVCSLELACRHPELLRGLVLCEPPLPPADDAPAGSADFLVELDALAAGGVSRPPGAMTGESAVRGGVAGAGPEAAAERFLRTVLGDPAYERMPQLYKTRCLAMWPQIRGDCHALVAYQPRYARYATVTVPTLLLGGDRSAPYFRPTLDALAAAMPAATLEILPGAGHMMQADVHRRFNERLVELATSLPQ